MSSPVQKAIARLREGLAAGDAYEAQQSVKTAYHRLKARRQLEEGYDLLQQAAVVQFGAGQFTCGLELAKLLVEAYKAEEVAATPGAFARLQAVLTALPAPPRRDAASQAAIFDAAAAWAESAIAWAARKGSGGQSLRDLHVAAGDWLYAQRGAAALGAVSRHYAAGINAEGLYHVLSDGFDPAKARDWDLYVCRAFLLVLASAPPMPQAAGMPSQHSAPLAAATEDEQQEHVDCAEGLLLRCQNDTSQPEFTGVPGFPLISFCDTLLELVATDPELVSRQSAAKLFVALRHHYSPALGGDPELGELLDAVAETYFDMQRQSPGGMGGMVGSLMQMLGGGGGMQLAG